MEKENCPGRDGRRNLVAKLQRFRQANPKHIPDSQGKTFEEVDRMCRDIEVIQGQQAREIIDSVLAKRRLKKPNPPQ